MEWRGRAVQRAWTLWNGRRGGVGFGGGMDLAAKTNS
jgi:hypothetical protein